VLSAFSIIVRLAWDLIQWCGLLLRPRESLEAEILFLRRQLALYRERGVKPRRDDAATRVTLALLSHRFDWRSVLVVVRPETLIGWHRGGLPAFLAMEVTSWTAADSEGTSRTDPTNGARESRVGSRADRE